MSSIINLNIADFVIVGVILASTLISILRGFVKEFISLFIWALGLWLAIKFYGILALTLEPYIDSDSLRQVISFAGIFLFVVIFGILFNYVLSFVVIKNGLSGTDRLLGTIFGFARGVLLVSVVLLLISLTSFVEEGWWQHSSLIPHFHFLIDWLKEFLPEKMTGITTTVV